MSIATEKIFITNRHGLKMAVQIEKPENPVGLAFVLHGRGGFKEQPYVRAFVEPLLANNYIVISFDATKSFGESEGSFENFNLTDYYADLEDVILWAKTQAWYQVPFLLCGHSLGGICTALYAEKHPNEVKALAPFSTAVSGSLSVSAYKPGEIDKWRASGYRTTIGASSGLVKKLKWSHIEDLMQYSLLPEANKLTMPVLLMVGEKDDVHPIWHQQIFYEALPGRKELHVIPGAPHTFKEAEHLFRTKVIIDKWLKSLK